MRILFLINNFTNGGASDALLRLIWGLNDLYINLKGEVFCYQNIRTNDFFNIKVQEGSADQLLEYIKQTKPEIIHWFRSDQNKIFLDLIKAVNKRSFCLPPIITTLCQKPTVIEYELHPIEIHHSNKIIFISQSINDLFQYKVVPSIQKTMIYFGSNFKFLTPKSIYLKSNELILFGRGSTLNKCPENMVINFNEINYKRKKFYIAGEGDSTAHREKSKNAGLLRSVYFIGFLKMEQWVKFLNKIDIFLYELPKNSFSSIDYTIQHAMAMGLPVVLMGPKSPRELIQHKKNGFIARNRNEFIKFAELLAYDSSLRESIGRQAALDIRTNFDENYTIRAYLTEYENFRITKDLYITKRHYTYLYSFYYYFRLIFSVVSMKLEMIALRLKIKLKVQLKSLFDGLQTR